MFGPLGQIFGGGGILGAAMNIASMCFPQLAIANALGNMLGSAIGGAINGAIDQLCKDLGLPKFIANMVKDAVSQALQQNQQPCDKQCGDAVNDKCGGAFDKFEKELCSEFQDLFKKYKGECDKANGGNGKGGGKSWFVALMQALGEIQNQQAAKIEKLSKEVSDVLGAGDDSAGSKQAQFDKMEEFKAEAKLQEVFANVTKSIGDAIGNAIATVARAQ
ncbi:hypothetical protein [Piscinibacter sp. XHJ-5]|uniref:hypothetical protein n=1 Tax=Piscinibacter sp. XHJ-5 TaxID=3037797 RepID=UPI002452D953|nr:hypothetical protein [Piscinibacter sp. XHJ-5]